MLAVIGFPLINTVLLSLQDQGVAGTESQFVGTDTYRDMLADPAMWKSLGLSFVWLFGNLTVQTVLAFATALLLARGKLWSRTARTWILLPWVIPTVAVAVIWQWLMNSNYGIVPKVLGFFGVDHVQFFADSTWALPTLIFMNSWHWFPLGAVIIFGALRTVPTEVYEAARVDGANAWNMFWRITLPILQPVLFALGLVGSLWSFNIIDSIYLVTKGGPAGASKTSPVYIYDTAFKEFQASEAAAASVVAIVLLGLLTWIYIGLARPKEV
ncbi:carbohydrate ABC transporter permease [Amycolatopsis palatopharyngis]|uniref:carbohydrate ABC transporter permease n=1 Tax=Amycolatopsis palatopharyngis TaxID=187982 RepID=UPI0013BEA02A|nr:sugar ABC transporter permease [Amycolatopsis palatopharyngis]